MLLHASALTAAAAAALTAAVSVASAVSAAATVAAAVSAVSAVAADVSAVSAIAAAGCQSGVHPTFTCTGRRRLLGAPCNFCSASQRRHVAIGSPTTMCTTAFTPACSAAYRW
jgi:hypothetical protein